jgi:ASCH domain
VTEQWFALSIRQPWIDLILKGLKSVEVRDWNVTRRGPILLHSSLTIDWTAVELFGYDRPWNLPRGKLVGHANISDSFEFTRELWLQTASRHLVIRPLGTGQYGAVLEKVLSFPSPVPCPGKLYFFPVPPNVAEKTARQLEAIGITS